MQTNAFFSGFKHKFIGIAAAALLLAGCSADEGPTGAAGGAPAVTFSASPTTVAAGGTTTFSYNAVGATGCVASGSWSGDKGTSGSEVVTVPTAPGSYAYTLTCTGSDGQTTANTVPITVTGSTTPPPAPAITFSASPTSVAPGGSTTLTYSTTGATSCTASGSWSGNKGTSGSEAITVPTTPGNYAYTLTCTGSGGQTSARTVNVTVTGSGSGGGGSAGTITGGGTGSVLPNNGTVPTTITENGTPLTGNFRCTQSALAWGPSPQTSVTTNGLVGATVTDLVNTLGGSTVTQLLNTVTAKELVADGNLDTYATFNETVAALAPEIESIDLVVTLNSTVPVGNFAVFGLSFPAGTLDLTVNQTLTVTTYAGTTVQETIPYTFVGLDLLGQTLTGDPAVFIGLKATKSFDRVVLSATPQVITANIANAFNAHELCTNGNFVTAP